MNKKMMLSLRQSSKVMQFVVGRPARKRSESELWNDGQEFEEAPSKKDRSEQPNRLK
jgi:hypothetical protein